MTLRNFTKHVEPESGGTITISAKQAKWLGIALWAASFLFLGICVGIAYAEPDNVWQAENGAMSGYTSDNKGITIIDTVVNNPEGNTLLDILPDKCWIRYVNTPWCDYKIIRYNYPLGNDTLNLSGINYRGSNGVGITGSFQRIGWKPMDNLSLSMWVMEGAKYTFGVDYWYPIKNNYGVESHIIYGQDFTHDINGSLWYNLDKGGSKQLYFGYDRLDGHNAIYLGAKKTF